LLYEFTGRRAFAIWISWTLASAVAWLAVHPAGANARQDAVMLLAGGALASVFHGFILWSRTLGQDVRLAWWVSSLMAWAVAIATALLLPWDEIGHVQPSGLPFVFFIAASGLLVGAAQAWALAGMRRAKSWIPVPAVALVAALYFANRLTENLSDDSWLRVFYADAASPYRLQGIIFGAIYGLLTGAAFVMVGRGERPRIPVRAVFPGRPAPDVEALFTDFDTPTTDHLEA
jgi:hypothetical protein